MAAVYVTLDYMDGRSVVRGPLYPDELDLTGLLFRLNEHGIATVTFVNAKPLTHLMQEDKNDTR
jgi:hypothetical protein